MPASSATIVIGQVAVATTPFESFAAMLNVPPPSAFRSLRRPPASIRRQRPTTEYVYGPTPPLALMVALNATPTSPELVAEHASVGPATIVIGKSPSHYPFESFAAMLNVPPPSAFRSLRRPPASIRRQRPTTEYVYGPTPPLALMVALNATPLHRVGSAQASVGAPTIVIGQVAVATTPFESFA